MCFFVYAPNAKITISYASESITLSKRRKSEVIADLLILNESEQPIEEVNIIYPNQFFHFKETTHVQEVIPVGEYEDITSTIIDEGSAYNWAYKDNHNQTFFKLCNDSLRVDSSDITERAQTLELTMPHPLDPSDLLKYKGQIGGHVEIAPFKGLTLIQWLMLQKINYTVFTAHFKPSIKSQESRWVRWRFVGRSAVSQIEKKNELKLRFKNQLQYDYQIQGMYDVKNQFVELLQFMRTNMKKYSLQAELISDIEELVDVFRKGGLDYPGKTTKMLDFTNVKILDWRLHINPSELDRITDIVMKGSAEVIGRLPNYLGTDEVVYPVYEWKAGPTVTFSNDPHKEYSFSIFFQSKEYSWLSASVYLGCIFIIILMLVILLFR